jgi:hypothetical protein
MSLYVQYLRNLRYCEKTHLNFMERNWMFIVEIPPHLFHTLGTIVIAIYK